MIGPSDPRGFSRRGFLGRLAAAGFTIGLLPGGEAAAATVEPPAARRRAVIGSDRQGFNRRWFAPNLREVHVPTRPDEVAPALTAAIQRCGRNVKVASGRHCYEDFVYNDATQAIIDMSGLGTAGFDPERDAYFVDAGCENWTAYRLLLNGFGRTLPDGSCYSVGAGGHISGGGYGLLSRAHGLSVDWVTAVDIVTWDAARGTATLRHVAQRSADADERDLFWAVCGGGGGNFGVIVRFYFAEPPLAPSQASIWTAAWRWADLDRAAFGRLVAAHTELVQELPDRQFTLLKLNHEAAGQVALILQVASEPGASAAGHARDADAAIAAARRRFAGIAPLATDTVQHLPFLGALQTLNGSGPNQFGKYKSAYMRKGFPEAQIDALYTWLRTYPEGQPRSGMAQTVVQVDSYGGAVNRRASTATPIPQRDSILKLQYQTYWNNASLPGRADRGRYRAQEEAHLRWIRGIYRDVYAAYGGTPDPARDATGTVDGCYVNYPDRDLGTHAAGTAERALRLYFGDNLSANARNLVAIKRRWDPADVFHHAQSIPVRVGRS